jgi:hypothetical protein
MENRETLQDFINEELEDVFFTNIAERNKAERLIEIGAQWQQEQDKNLYNEEEVRKLLETQRGNCYVAVFTAIKDKTIATKIINAPEPSGGKWIKRLKQ